MLKKSVSLPFSFNTHTGLLMGVQIYPKLCQKLPMKKFVNATKQVVKRETTQNVILLSLSSLHTAHGRALLVVVVVERESIPFHTQKTHTHTLSGCFLAFCSVLNVGRCIYIYILYFSSKKKHTFTPSSTEGFFSHRLEVRLFCTRRPFLFSL